MNREEAINVVRNIYQTDKEKEALSILIPELAESEDERMWDKILAHFDWHSRAPYLTHQECDEIKAFLEKQKELLHVSETYKENADSFIDEDEEIRKALIEFLREAYSRGNAPEECAKWLVWLDWTKVKKPTAEEVLIKAGLKPYKDGNQWCILAGDNIQEGICGFGDTIEDALYRFILEILDLQSKRKEQKLTEWSEEDEEEFSNLTTLLFILEGNGSIKQGVASHYQNWLNSFRNKSKQEWLVDDKQYVEDILALLQFGASKHSTRQVESWLKSLPERFNLQPKQEWSEEDKRKLNMLYSIVSQAADAHAFFTTTRLISDRDAIELHNFLKSLLS